MENEAEIYAGIILDELKELESAADIAEELDDYIKAVLLDFEIFTSNRGAVRIEMLRTTGGPHAEIIWSSHDSEKFVVETHWGGDSFSDFVLMPKLGDMLYETYFKGYTS